MKNLIPKPQFFRLVFFANRLSCHYFAPVYLTGSSLVRANYNDVDLVIVLPNDYWEFKYGSIADYLLENKGKRPPTVQMKLARDVAKRWVEGCKGTGLNLDIKIRPVSIFSTIYPGHKVVRLDNSNF